MKKGLMIGLVFGVMLFAFSFVPSVSALECVGPDCLDLTVPGCDEDLDKGLIGGVAQDTCSKGRNYFCDAESQLRDVLTSPGACFDGAAGSLSCCPSGFQCLEQGGVDDAYLCQLCTQDCIDYTTRNTCTGNFNNIEDCNCYWSGDDLTGSCGYYPTTCGGFNETDCGNAAMTASVAQGECGRPPWVDSDGGFHVIDLESCLCEWDSAAAAGAGKCELNYNVTSTIGENDELKCNKEYEYSDCVNGVQPFTINATVENTTVLADGLLEAFDCVSEPSGKRVCGVKLIEVPFFNWMNLIIAGMLISMVYFVKIYKGEKLD